MQYCFGNCDNSLLSIGLEVTNNSLNTVTILTVVNTMLIVVAYVFIFVLLVLRCQDSNRVAPPQQQMEMEKGLM